MALQHGTLTMKGKYSQLPANYKLKEWVEGSFECSATPEKGVNHHRRRTVSSFLLTAIHT